MKKQYTINEIAEILKLSRNTVAKVINGKDGVSEKTRKLILDFLSINPSTADKNSLSQYTSAQKGNVIFTYHLSYNEYLHNILTGIERFLKENGYALILNIIRDNDVNNISLPASLYNGSVCGVISFNIFSVRYWNEITSLNIPSVFIDTFYQHHLFAGKADIVAPENSRAIHEIMSLLIKKGKKAFSFIGHPKYCYSTNQRWSAFKDVLEANDLPLQEECCIYDNLTLLSDIEQIALLKQRIKAMPKCPDVFLCASDTFAIVLSCALQDLGYRIPDDVSIIGFDNLSETVRQSPSITTIDAHSEYLGKMAAKKILERLEDPKKHYEFTLYETNLVIRDSTIPFNP